MRRVFVVSALLTLTAAPAIAQNADTAGASSKITARKDTGKSDYWASRDLSSILTKVVTIKVR